MPGAAHPAPASPVSDEVDDIVARWRRERPDLDVTPLEVLSRVSRLAKHLDRARRAAFAAHGLEAWEFDVLSALRRQGEPYQLSPGALLRSTLVTSGTMTNRVDRLAAAGLVRRDKDPQDKRGVLVQLTDAGKATVDAAMSSLLDRERELLDGLDRRQQSDLAALLRVLLAPFDAAGAEPGPRARRVAAVGGAPGTSRRPGVRGNASGLSTSSAGACWTGCGRRGCSSASRPQACWRWRPDAATAARRSHTSHRRCCQARGSTCPSVIRSRRASSHRYSVRATPRSAATRTSSTRC